MSHSNHRSTEVDRLLTEGRVAFQRFQHEQAWVTFQTALDVAVAQNDVCGEASALLALSRTVLHYYPDDGANVFDSSEVYARRAYERFCRLDDSHGMVDSLCEFAKHASFCEAISLLEKGLHLARQVRYKAGESMTLLKLAQLYRLNGNSAESQRFLDESIRIARRHKLKGELAYALSTAAIHRGNDLAEQVAYWDESAALCREAEYWFTLVQTLTVKATCLPHEPSWDAEASACLDEAIAICQKCAAPDYEDQCRRSLAAIARRRGDVARAESLESQCHSPEPDFGEIPEELLRICEKGDWDTKLDAVKRAIG